MILNDKTTQDNLTREWANPAPVAEPSFNAWSFAAAGVKSPIRGMFETLGNIADFNAAPGMGEDMRTRPVDPNVVKSRQQWREIAQGMRAKADSWAPDPETASQADQVISGIGSGITRAVGAIGTLGPAAGATAFGLGEADSTYQRMVEKNPAIDKTAALKVAGVTGLAAGVGAVIPMAGSTVAGTLGLIAAGGPGIYAAQEALARKILQNAGETAEAAQHDPGDRLGLALSLAIPGVIGGVHIRGLTKARPPATLHDVVAGIESNNQRFAADGSLTTSPKGAQGEMQVMPGTAKSPGYGVKPAADGSPAELARVGHDYLDAMVVKYSDPDKALAAYNAGPGAVDAALKKHGGDWLAHMPDETQKYVAKAGKRMGDHVAERGAADPAVVDAARVKVTEDHLARVLPDEPNARSEMMRAADDIGAGRLPDDIAPMIGAAEREANFKAWFGDSKLVDAEGKPLVVYHGTTADFQAFDAGKLGGNTGHTTAKLGFFFTADPAISGMFNEKIDVTVWPVKYGHMDGSTTMPVYLSIKNPKVMTAADFQLMARAGGHGNGVSAKAVEADVLRLRDPSMLERLFGKTYDGVLVKGDPALADTMGAAEWAADTWVAFKPKQIKSAIGNSGRFDPNSGSLTDPHPAPTQAQEPARNVLPTDAPIPAKAADSRATPTIAAAQQAVTAAGGRDFAATLAEANHPPEVHNLAIGLHETGADKAKAAGLLADFERAARADTESPLQDLAADAVERARQPKPETGEMPSLDAERLKTLHEAQPDMMVSLPGHEAPMTLAEAMLTAKREADMIRTDAELVRAAVTCALENGAMAL